MKFSHRKETRAGRALDIFTDDDAGLRIIVSRLGAELVSIARRASDGSWRGFLHRDNDLSAPPKGWANHATVMGFFLHRLKNERSLYRGQEIRGGTHSFLRVKTWSLVQVDEAKASATYRITPNDYTASEYPLKVTLDLTYCLEGDSIVTSFRFTNGEPELSAHLEFGLHPGFAAESFESFGLQMPAGKYRRHFSPSNYLSGETAEIDFPGGEMPFERARLPGSYILEFVDLPERTFRFHDRASGRAVAFDLGSAPYVTLWSDGGPFLCLEPCWGLTDHEQQRPFEEKEGIQIIPAHGTLDASFCMTPQLLP